MKTDFTKSLYAAFMILVTSHAFCAPPHPSATGVARLLGAANHESYFLLILKMDDPSAPGVQFHPMVRIVFDDGTWIYGATGCFPTGAAGDKETGGDVRSFGRIPDNKNVKSIQLVARLGDPAAIFTGAEEATGVGILDRAALDRLIAAGGFLIEIPVRPRK